MQNVLCRYRSGSGAEDDVPDHGTKTAFELPIRFAHGLRRGVAVTQPLRAPPDRPKPRRQLTN